MSKKILVAYFSASGVTASIANQLAAEIGADIYEIAPKNRYTSEDLNWQNEFSRSSIEMKDITSRPELADGNASVEGADVVFIGFPIWWYTAPHIINSFLEEYEFSGKHVVLFATSGGTDIDKSVKDLQNTYTRIHFDGGRKFNVGISRDELKNWANKYIQ
ncbi:flavodoxin [Butyrivibrio sp. X503]|uniref:flavodoxin n=1 Tax=unclassified Butyrivibrio TaxID=2639466 RepID=UPI000EA96D00|nr:MULTISPECIES: flavodoxin [unclassified Butyrivibrio]RKM55865.1 flavodoxin [Butyrivibrio sp. X503]RKM63147.1 flavodoxin [Butyrivibrio sp. XB500-5]